MILWRCSNLRQAASRDQDFKYAAICSPTPSATPSIHIGTVTASLITRQLASYPRQNGVAAALRELGRLERTRFTLDWISDPGQRRTTGQELNKGEARNSLARAVFPPGLGAREPDRRLRLASRPEFRDRRRVQVPRRLKTARACQIRLAFQDLYDQPSAAATAVFPKKGRALRHDPCQPECGHTVIVIEFVRATFWRLDDGRYVARGRIQDR
jgi:hypothetical protein